MISDKSISILIKRALIILLILFLPVPYVNGQGRSGSGNPVVPGETISPQVSGINLECLFDGIADLYCYCDKETDHYLLTHQNGRVFTLNIPKQGRRPNAEDGLPRYAGTSSVLKLFLADAPELVGKISVMTPVRESLVSLMHAYHEYLTGSDTGIIYEERPNALEVRAGIFAGYRSVIFHVNPGGELDGFIMDPASYPTIGFSLTSQLPRVTRNLSLTLNMRAARRYVYGYYTEKDMNPERTTYEELHLHNVIMQGDILLSYSYGAGRMIPFLCAGATGQGIIKDNSRLDSDTVEEGIVISESEPFWLERKFSPGVPAGGRSYLQALFTTNSLFKIGLLIFIWGQHVFISSFCRYFCRGNLLKQ